MTIALQAAAPRLAPLRDELELGPGPNAADGSPTWTLHDPPTGRFVRLGWLEFEILRRWTLGTPQAIAAAIAAETTLRPTAEDVGRLARLLVAAHLLRPGSPESIAQLSAAYARAHVSSWAWIALKNYLFFRIPLLHPDRLLDALLGRLRWVFTGGFLVATLLAGALGLVLAIRQWEVFWHGFPYLATGEGIAVGLLALVLVKLLHELGHGLTAKLFGCRVRTAGVAVMLFVPVLYTDVTEAWRLADRRRRLLIGAAGILTELGVACWALLLWSFLPEGPIRSVAFFWSTTTWVLTLLVNANPLMRFDGYFILSDMLDQPNLQETSFALARWHLRRHLLGAKDPPPPLANEARRRLLIAFAYATWVYRLLLFLAIAAIVYAMSFKLLGIFLAAVEIAWFILRPVVAEMRVWWRGRRTLGANPALVRSVFVLAAMVGAVVVPWRSSVHGDALVGAERRSVLYAPQAAVVTGIFAAPGRAVREGEGLFRLAAPHLDHQAGQLRRAIENLGWQMDALAQQQDSVARAQIVQREREAMRLQLAGIEAMIGQLELRAPFDGVVVEAAEDLRPQEWVARGEPLALVVDRSSLLVEALVAEEDVRRVMVGAPARVRPRNPDVAAFDAVVEAVDVSALREFPDPILASTHQGPVPARAGPDGTSLPGVAVYRVRLRPVADLPVDRAELATVRIAASAESPAARFLRTIWGTLLRESGF